MSAKKTDSSINIIPEESVNQYWAEADRIEGNPEAMLALVDLIFGFSEDHLPPT